MTRTLGKTLLTAVLAIGLAGPVAADPGDNDTTEAQASVMATRAHPSPRPHTHRPPPRRRYPRRPPPVVYHPAPRPVRVVPAPAPVVVAPRHYTPPRFHLMLAFGGNSVIDDDSNLESPMATGIGFELGAGWRVHPNLGIDLNWWASFHDTGDTSLSDDAMLSAFTLDFRIFPLGQETAVQPYLQAGLGAYFLSRDSFSYDTLSGLGFELGGGLDFHLSPFISIGGKLLYRGANMDNTDGGYAYYPYEESFVSTFSYSVDLKFHF